MGAVGRLGQQSLPFELSSFVGREAEVDRLESLVAGNRLVTVVGPGGAGKTRVALRVAHRLSSRFEDGVWLVELGQIGSSDQVARAVADSVGVRQHPGLSIVESLVTALGRLHLLLVVDNCEHVLDGTAELARAVLAAGADLRVLATSRQALEVEGESLLSLAPMDTPPTAAPTDLIGDFDSVRLFATRATQADANFLLDSATAAAVADIVRNADGLPLAIEMAAAQLDAVNLEQLKSETATGWAGVVNRVRGSPERHRSLRSCVDWGYDLLGDGDKIAFRRLAVLPAPFTIDAASALVGYHAGDVVARLVRRSMLSVAHQGADGRSRYAMLETVRAYAAGLLSSDEAAVTREAALGWYVLETERLSAMAESSTTELEAIGWIDAEQDNLREMLGWAAVCDVILGLRLAVAMCPWFLTQARWREGSSILERAVRSCAEAPPQWVGVAEKWIGQLCAQHPDDEAAVLHLTRALELLEPFGPSPATVDALWALSMPAHDAGRMDDAASLARRALDMARAISYPTGIVKACVCLAVAAIDSGDAERGLHWAQEANAVDPAEIAGWAARWQSLVLSWAHDTAGDVEAAEDACVHGLQSSVPAGDRYAGTFLRIQLATLEVKAGQTDEARPRILQAVVDADQRGDGAALLAALEVATAWLARQEPDTAATLFGAASAIAEGIGYSYSDHYWNTRLIEPVIADIRTKLGDGGARAENVGRRMGRDEVLRLVRIKLQETIPIPAAARSTVVRLTPREHELLDLLAEGLTDAEIAQKLFISVRTVRSHLDRIREKTGYRRRAELTRLALCS